MDKNVLKKLLTEIKNNDNKVPLHQDPYELSMEMMSYIGDIDSELRDSLILSILETWIIEGVLTTKEVQGLLMIAMDDNHLTGGLGAYDDTVFCRTFSAEVIACSIYRHRNEKFLSCEELHKVFHQLLKFYNEDRDVRGYVEGKGWAHGAAHGADALDEFARCDEFGYDELKSILASIHRKININHYGYIHFEEERMITTVLAILERNIISIKEIQEWIDNFGRIDKSGKYPEDLVIEFNVNTFLKSLYFRLMQKKEYEAILDEIREVLLNISRFV